jgi:hypothetical protein
MAAAGLRERRVQHRKLAGPADQDWGRYTHRHIIKNARWHRQAATPIKPGPLAARYRRGRGDLRPASVQNRISPCLLPRRTR